MIGVDRDLFHVHECGPVFLRLHEVSRESLRSLFERSRHLAQFWLRIDQLAVWRAVVHDTLEDDFVDAAASGPLTVSMARSVRRGTELLSTAP